MKYIFMGTWPTSATCSAWPAASLFLTFLPLLPKQVLL